MNDFFMLKLFYSLVGILLSPMVFILLHFQPLYGIVYKIVKQTNEQNKSEVSDAAAGEASRLDAVAHVCAPTVEIQVPAAGVTVLCATPVVAS